jgi:hypothetical protein
MESQSIALPLGYARQIILEVYQNAYFYGVLFFFQNNSILFFFINKEKVFQSLENEIKDFVFILNP